jgi:hypothetical protein
MNLQTRAVFAVLCFAVLLPAAAAAQQVILVYRQTVDTREDRVEITERTLPAGAELGVNETSGESYLIQTDDGGGVIACRFEFPSGGTSWTARRAGALLRLEGTVQGRPASRTFTIDRHPWYESVERSLQSFAISGSRQPLEFWMIEPYGGSAYLMAGRIEEREQVEVNGNLVDAVRVVVRPAGILSFIWSSTYWFAPTDGTFLKSQSRRGILALVPMTTVELLEDRRKGG